LNDGVSNVAVRDADAGDEPVLRGLEVTTWSPRSSPGPPPDPDRPVLARYGVGNVLVALIDAAIARARERGARRLVLRVLSSNDAARRLYASRGFEVEGGRRDAFLLEGGYIDDLMMGIDLSR
jgi:hypothetical protein